MTETIIFQQTSTYAGGYIYGSHAQHPTAGILPSSCGPVFVTPKNPMYKITRVTITLSRDGTPGLGKLVIYEVTSGYDGQNFPMGAAVASSDNVDASTFVDAASGGTVEFTFTGAQQAELKPYTPYIAAFQSVSGLWDGSDCVWTTLGAAISGRIGYYQSSTWRMTSSNIAMFTVYGEFVRTSDVTVLGDWGFTNLNDGGATGYTALQAVHPTVSGTLSSAVGQTWRDTFTAVPAEVNFFLSPTGSPTGVLRAEIYAHTGTYGTTGLPTGSAIALSEAIDIDDLTVTDYPCLPYAFRFTRMPQLEKDTPYVVIVKVESGVVDAANCVRVGVDTSTADSPSGNGVYYRNGWLSTTGDRTTIIRGLRVQDTLANVIGVFERQTPLSFSDVIGRMEK